MKPRTMAFEPSLQGKKRVEPPFMKTVPAKNDFDGVPLQSRKRVPSPSQKPTPAEPLMQAKKRVMPEFAQTDTSLLKPTQCEPPLQSKRRTPGPPTTMSNGFFENGQQRDAEFVLLGNQDKFTENVKYKMKQGSYQRENSPPKQMKIQKKSVETQETRSYSKAAPVVNTDQFKKPATPLAPRKEKNYQSQVVEEGKQSNVVKEPKVKRSPRVEDNKQQAKSQKEVSRSSEVRLSKVKEDEVKNLDSKDPVKSSMKGKKFENVNESAQTNQDKGVTSSKPEDQASANYALKYKSGIAPPRPSKKVSEYQKQFAWKTGPIASPLLTAEQEASKKKVVYNSNPTLSPPKKAVIPKVTEYQKQFKAFKLVPVPSEEPVEVPKKRTKLQKSKSMESLSPGEIRPAGSAPVISANNKRLTLETDQVVQQPVPQVPRRKQRQYRSEYDSNFRSPTRFDYVRGSWHGAAPPEVRMEGPEEAPKTPALTNWFAEVLELRRKAQEYRQRALGTHFSREHLVQLMARQNEMWEASTPTARSTISALSLESGLASHRQPRGSNQNARKQELRERESNAATMSSAEDLNSDRISACGGEEDFPVKKQAWAEQSDGQQTPSTFTEDCEDVDPTPRREDQGPTRKRSDSRRRHHLDRTTPSQGGAILSSPPDTRKKHSGKRMVGKSADSITLGSVDDETPRSVSYMHRPLAGQETYKVNLGEIAPTPTCGMPSRDSHALRDDSLLVDQALQTKYILTPARPTPGGLSGIDEGFGLTYNKNKLDDWTGVQRGGEVDDDVLSLSVRSIASSCSLASATLDRARRRKDTFWGSSSAGVQAK